MIHANISQLRVTINDESHFDTPLKFRWECSEGESDVKGAVTHYYDYNKSSYLGDYNLVQEFFGKRTERKYQSRQPIIATTI